MNEEDKDIRTEFELLMVNDNLRIGRQSRLNIQMKWKRL